MADINDLIEASRSGGSLPAPVVVNPLAAAQSAAQVANSVYGVREKQAEQALGAIMQQATDGNGNVDYAKARLLASQAGPVVQMGMQKMLMDNQQLDTNSYNLHTKRMSQANDAVGALIGRYPNGIPQDAAHAAIDQEVSTGLITPAIGEQLKKAFGADPRQNSLAATQLYFHNMTNQQQLERMYGTRQTISTPQGTYNITQPPPGPGQPNIEVPHGPTPGATTESTVPYDDQGIIPRDANGVPTRPPKGWTSTTVPVTAVPGVQTGGPPRVIPGTGTGAGTPPAAGAGTGPALPPGAPAAPPGTTLRGGRFTTTAPSAPTAPATPAPPVAAAKPPVVTAPPQGQPEKLKSDVEAYTRDQADYPNVQTRAQNMAHAYDALQQLKAATGRGAEGINSLRSWAQTLGILPAGAVNEQRLFEIVHKYTERAMIDAAGGGSTDLGRRMAEQANAGTLLSTPANLEIIRNDMGKTLQTAASYLDHKDKTGTGYLEGRAKVADSTDPRGFVWSMYSPEEQARINAEVDKDPDAAAKLHKAIGMARRLKLQVPGLTMQPPAQKQSFLAPQAPTPNLLQMTG